MAVGHCMGKKPSAINIIWLYLVLLSILVAAYTGRMDAITKSSFEAAKNAVTLAIALVGAMALWLGIMKVAENAGLMRLVSHAIRPVMKRLFPEVPTEHPAMSAMIMNIAANMLGLGNAATPMGIKAMAELDKLNPEKGTATNAMCLFLAINTSNVALLPISVIAVRAAAGASNPGAILIPTLIATSCSTIVAIIVAKLFARRSPDPIPVLQEIAVEPENVKTEAREARLPEDVFKPGTIGKSLAIVIIVAFFAAIPWHFIAGHRMPAFNYGLLVNGTTWFIPFLMGFFLLFGYFRGVKVYEALTDGAKEGFNVAVRIIPFLVAIFVAIGMFRDSGALDLFAKAVNPLTSLVGFPIEALPVALLRPLSGTGSFAVMTEVISRAPDSFASFLVSVLQGSTETTFYVLAVYFGSVAIRRTRYALTVGLIADAAGIIAALGISHLMFRG
jgi:spore maturation protein SpmA